METFSDKTPKEIKHDLRIYFYEKTIDSTGNMLVAVYFDASTNHRMAVKFDMTERSNLTFNEEVTMGGLYRKKSTF